MKSFMIALLVLASASAASASDEEQEKAQAEKVICKTDKITGNRTKVRRTCMTRAEWDAVAEATRKNMSDFYRDSNSTAPAISDGAGSGPKIPN